MASAAASIRGYASDLRQFADDEPRQGAEMLADAIEARLRADTGGDGGFSHGREMGRATVDVRASAGTADVIGAGSRAVWAILEHGTASHDVHARRGGVLSTPHGPRRSVHVSGVAARQTWTKANEATIPLVQRETERRFAQLGA